MERDPADDPISNRLPGDAGPDRHAHQCRGEQTIDDVLTGIRHGAAGERALQLPERNETAGEGDGTDHDREQDRDRRLRGELVEVGLDDGDCGNERRGDATEAVEGCDQLGHRRHLHAQRQPCTERRSDEETGDDRPPSDDVVGHQGDHDRREHAGRGDPVAGSRGTRRAEQLQPDDERDA